MTTERPRENRHREIETIVDAKSGGVKETRDEANKYTVVGAAHRRTFANWLTPIEEHFVCHRNDIPDIEADTWTVSVTGRVETETDVSMADIKAEYPTVAVAHTMECAGNGRGQHQPETGSVQVSTDGDETWSDADLFGPEFAGAWRLFRYDWDAEPGTYVLMSRATDDLDRRQPARISEPDAWRDALTDDETQWYGRQNTI